MSNNIEVASVILDQMGGHRSLAMIGGYSCTAVDEPYGALSFSFKAKSKNASNYCKIILTAMDTYTVEFGRVYGRSYRVVSKHDDIYCDMLMDLFEEETGLFLTFNRRD